MSSRSVKRPGLSQNDCFPGKGSGGGPADEDQMDRYWSRNVSVTQGHNERMSSCRYYYFLNFIFYTPGSIDPGVKKYKLKANISGG